MGTSPSSINALPQEKTTDAQQIGVVEHLLGKLEEIIPIVDLIKQSIQESSSSIPRASVQLTSVTRATEMATVEILNVVESLSRSITQAEGRLASLRERHAECEAFERSFTEHMETSLASHSGNGALKSLRDLWNSRPQRREDAEHVRAIGECLAKAQSDSMQITVALQVQDITSQQIAGVLHLIETVRLQLMNTLHHAESTDTPAPSLPSTHLERAKSFDMNAQYNTSTDRQATADDIIQQWNATNGSQQRQTLLPGTDKEQ